MESSKPGKPENVPSATPADDKPLSLWEAETTWDDGRCGVLKEMDTAYYTEMRHSQRLSYLVELCAREGIYDADEIILPWKTWRKILKDADLARWPGY